MSETTKRLAHGVLARGASLWHALEHTLGTTGHLLLLALGALLTLLGLLVTLTLYAAPLGVGLMVVGILVVIRNAYG